MKTRTLKKRRAGAVLVLSAVMMAAMLALVALAVDVGYLMLVRTQLQTSADSAALAATWDLLNHASPISGGNSTATLSQADTIADMFAAENLVAGDQPTLAVEDVVFGRFSAPFSLSNSLAATTPDRVNATQVSVRRTTTQNGPVLVFFARVFGTTMVECRAQATAAFVDNFSGFTVPSAGTGNVPILPFVCDIQSWNAMLKGGPIDQLNWDEQDKSVVRGSDGIPEINIFPQGTGAPGNRGTLNIGRANNGTPGLARQIREGLSASDLVNLGGSFQLNADGILRLPGDPGISAGMKDDLASIIGQTRVMPLFSDYPTGQGANAHYTIIGFAGVRIMGVDLTGKLADKYLMVQPASVSVVGGIPGSDENITSYNVYSPVQLVQ